MKRHSDINDDKNYNLKRHNMKVNAGGTLPNFNENELYKKYIEALRYDNGYGVEKNYYKAFELYSICALAGDPYAQFCLAKCYENGRGVIANHQQALEFYTRAANLGHPDAQTYLTNFYNNLRNNSNAKNKRRNENEQELTHDSRNVFGRI